MRTYQTYFVGRESEVAHHAQPLMTPLSAEIVEPDRIAAIAKAGDLAIFFSEHFQPNRRAWFELNRLGCNTLYAIDGILEWRNAWENRPDEPACPWTMRPVLSDKVACIGPSQARILDSWGNGGKTEVVGIPRLDNLSGGNARGSGKVVRILVATAKWPAYTPKQVAQVTQSLQDIKQYFDDHSSIAGKPVEIVWRLTKDLHQSIGVANQLRDTGGQDLASSLQQVDAVITTPSTIILESMICQTPTCILDYTNSPRYVDAAWSITAAEQIGDTVDQLLSPSPARKYLQDTLLADALYRESPATERMQRLAEQMIRISHDCRAKNQPVIFPPQILGAPSVKSDFDRRQFFSGTAQTPSAELEPLLAQLDEAHRRIAHLVERNRLLDTTLDGIHADPLLKRIIRAQQSLGSLISRFRWTKRSSNKPTTTTSSKVT